MSSSTSRTKVRSHINDKSEYYESDVRLDSDDEEVLNYDVRRSPSLWTRLVNLVPGLNVGRNDGSASNYAYHYYAAPTDELSSSPARIKSTSHIRRSGCSKWLMRIRRTIVNLPVIILCLFGALHILLVLFGKKKLFWDLEEYGPYFSDKNKIAIFESTGSAGSRYSTAHVQPIPCHSHNDYWRKVPLFDALSWGLTSVEADVWHFNDEDELFIGHNTFSLRPERTFTKMYVEPLVKLLDNINSDSNLNPESSPRGVFEMDPTQTLVLLVDFKSDGHDLFPYVHQHLESLRKKNYLSFWDGSNFISRPITVVGSGNAPFDLILQQTNSRDIFFDAPLDELWESPRAGLQAHNRKRAAAPGQGKTGIDIIRSADDFNISNSYYASVPLSASVGFPWKGELSEEQLQMIRGQIEGAQRRGLKARYWDTPSWPTSLRNYVWQVLVNEGADMLNVDDLKTAAALDWRVPVRHGWIDA